MADLVNTTSGITRLNTHNYQSWQSRIKSYLEGQDLWEVVNGNDTIQPENAETLRKWKVKATKAMYVLKSTIEDELLGGIGDDDTPNMAWDTFASLFSIIDEARLQDAKGRVRMINPKLYKAAKEGDVSIFTELCQVYRTEEEAKQLGIIWRTQHGNNNILHIAARAGHEKFVAKALLHYPFLLDQANSQGDTPLLVAARFGHLEVVKELTKSATENPPRGAGEELVHRQPEQVTGQVGMAPALENQTDSNSSQSEQGTISHSVVINVEDGTNSGDMATAMEEGPVHVQLDGLIPNHWRVKNLEGTTVTTALHEALRNGHEKVALHLLGLKPELTAFNNVAGESPLFLAAESHCQIFLKDILLSKRRYSTKGPDGQNALHAARNCDDTTIYELISKEPDLMWQLDKHGKAAIHYAVEANYWAFLDQMLKADASIALFPDADGYTPLLRAASRGDLKICQDILEKCPESVEAHNYHGRNALHLFKLRKKSDWDELLKIPEIRELLNIGDDEGNTPLHLAIKENHHDKAMFLIGSPGIHLGAVNKKGLTALDLCESKWNPLNIQPQGLLYLLLWRRQAPHGRRPNDQDALIGGLVSKPFINTMTLVATILATVTFAAAYTMPGGFDTSPDNMGVAILVKKASLKVFILADSIAMCCSMAVMFLLMWAMIAEKNVQTELAKVSSVLLPFALLATMMAFVSALFAVIAPTALWVPILICVFCSYGMLYCYSAVNILFGRIHFLFREIPGILLLILCGSRRKGGKTALTSITKTRRAPDTLITQ